MFDFFRKLYDLWKAYRQEKDKPDPKPEPKPPEPKPEPVEPTPGAMPDPNRPDAYRRGFLWKPQADGGRPLVVLIPSAFTHNTTKVAQLRKDGQVIESSRRNGSPDDNGQFPNGNREHYRFSKFGEHYAAPIDVVVETTNGIRWVWTVGNTAARNDGNITPKVER